MDEKQEASDEKAIGLLGDGCDGNNGSVGVFQFGTACDIARGTNHIGTG